MFFAKKNLNNSERKNGNNKITGNIKDREASDVKPISGMIDDEAINDEKLD